MTKSLSIVRFEALVQNNFLNGQTKVYLLT